MIAPKHIRIPNHVANSLGESDEKSSSIWSWRWWLQQRK